MSKLRRWDRVLVFCAIVLLAFAVRVIYGQWARACPMYLGLVVDGVSYDQWSDRIAGGDWLGSKVFYQAPLYPYFLAVVKLIVGKSLPALRLVQFFIGSLAAGILFLAGTRMFNRAVGVIAGLMLALYPSAVFFDGCIQK